jgi:hypothetical protein
LRNKETWRSRKESENGKVKIIVKYRKFKKVELTGRGRNQETYGIAVQSYEVSFYADSVKRSICFH